MNRNPAVMLTAMGRPTLAPPRVIVHNMAASQEDGHGKATRREGQHTKVEVVSGVPDLKLLSLYTVDTPAENVQRKCVSIPGIAGRFKNPVRWLRRPQHPFLKLPPCRTVGSRGRSRGVSSRRGKEDLSPEPPAGDHQRQHWRTSQAGHAQSAPLCGY